MLGFSLYNSSELRLETMVPLDSKSHVFSAHNLVGLHFQETPVGAWWLFFFLRFTYSWETYEERWRHRQKEKQTPCREPGVGLDPKTPGSRSEPKADTQPLSHPGYPSWVAFIKFVFLPKKKNSSLVASSFISTQLSKSVFYLGVIFGPSSPWCPISKSCWVDLLNNGWQTFCKGPGSKYFQICRPYGLYYNYLVLPWSMKQP